MKREICDSAQTALKDFQKRTVNYVFSRFFTDENKTNRFLIADEVGLGKTLVARGIVAETIYHLDKKWREEINIIYISSNSAIAIQNTKKLNVSSESNSIINSRVTLIPVHKGSMNNSNATKVNLISLTPGTTFKLRNSTGVKEERAFLFHLLKRVFSSIDENSIKKLLRVNANSDTWNDAIDDFPKISGKIRKEFRLSIRSQKKEFIKEFKNLCERFEPLKEDQEPCQDLKKERNKLVGKLRRLLANVCIDDLKPNLIIMDEFHKFSNLLYDKKNQDAELMTKLINYKEKNSKIHTKILLLSATPYKMLALPEGKTESNEHYEEFRKVLEFLFDSETDCDIVNEISKDFVTFRELLNGLPETKLDAMKVKKKIQENLIKVIARTERSSIDYTNDPFICTDNPKILMKPNDLKEIKAVYGVGQQLETRRSVEYWKSSPYLLNFMLDYDIKTKLLKETKTTDGILLKSLNSLIPYSMSNSKINEYKNLQIPNGRMRKLMEEIFDSQLDESLWIPPCMSYYSTSKSKLSSKNTKSLVFSSWRFTPAVISALVSYKSECQKKIDENLKYKDKTPNAPLQFKYTYKEKDRDQPAGLRMFLLFYPSPTLAELGDPLKILSENEKICTLSIMKKKISSKLNDVKKTLRTKMAGSDGHLSDWLLPTFLDQLMEYNIRSWLGKKHDGLRSVWSQTHSNRSRNKTFKSKTEKIFSAHVDKLISEVDKLMIGPEIQHKKSTSTKISSKFNDLLEKLALGSPAVCAIRSLKRIAPSMNWDDHRLLSEATKIALGFRIMLNQRSSMGVIRNHKKGKYIDNVLDYCVEHNLQSVLDEYTHILFSELNLENEECSVRIKKVSDAIVSVLTTNPSLVDFDEIRILSKDKKSKKKKFETNRSNMRVHFAMRLTEKESESTNSHIANLRNAFNSPFKPFVLATTSIGQEGLDFHPYCRRVYHWNLPKSPVELEQREGRVHRFKNHAVRLNLAANYSSKIMGIEHSFSDPWKLLFSMCEDDLENFSDEEKNMLKPYWVLNGKVQIEQKVLMLPFSREVERFGWLIHSRSVYRLTFGQQRQMELLNYLNSLRREKKLNTDDISELQIDLQPSDD